MHIRQQVPKDSLSATSLALLDCRWLGGLSSTIVPETRQNDASGANGRQLACFRKWKKERDLRGKATMSEKWISVSNPPCAAGRQSCR